MIKNKTRQPTIEILEHLATTRAKRIDQLITDLRQTYAENAILARQLRAAEQEVTRLRELVCSTVTYRR